MNPLDELILKIMTRMAEYRREITKLTEERKILRDALVGLVGTDEPDELDAMAAAFNLSTIAPEDKIATINAISALKKIRPTNVIKETK